MRAIVVLGLVIYTIVACSGAFIESGLSSPFIIFWLIGYLLLSFAIFYDAYVAPQSLKPFPLILLGIILLNFLVQVSGGVHSSVWPAYILFAVLVAALSPPRWTYVTIAVILTLEPATVLISGEAGGHGWPS